MFRNVAMSRNGAALGLAALLAVASLAAAAPASATPGGGSNPHGGRSQCELAPGRSTITVQSGGLDRTVVVHVPTTGKRSAALPLVLDLHGSNSTPTEQLTRSQLDKTAEQEGFIVAAPQGAIPLPAGFSWNVPFTATDVAGAPDDVTFLADLIATLTDDGCVDASRVYAAGYSGGGRLVSQFACEHPELVAAIAPVAGLRAGAALTTAAGLVPDPATCAPRKGVPVITFNGTADPTNPFDGGGAPYWGYGALAASERWAEINGCKTAKETRVSASVTVVTHRGCKQHAAVLQYVVAGGGHTWPGGNAAAFPNSGVTTQEISASNLMWNFFERYKSHRH